MEESRLIKWRNFYCLKNEHGESMEPIEFQKEFKNGEPHHEVVYSQYNTHHEVGYSQHQLGNELVHSLQLSEKITKNNKCQEWRKRFEKFGIAQELFEIKGEHEDGESVGSWRITTIGAFDIPESIWVSFRDYKELNKTTGPSDSSKG